MTRFISRVLLIVALFVSFCWPSGSALAGAPKEAKAEAKDHHEKSEGNHKKREKERKTFTIEAKPLKIDTTVDGVFVSKRMSQVILLPESWSTFKIEEIVPHGATVQEGETLVRFEERPLLEAIADLELSQRLEELAILRAEQEIPRLKRSLAMRLTDARQSFERATEDYERYKEEERQRSIDSINMNLKSSKFSLDYVRDELEQLEKMYEADDLTEETEEIILRRQRMRLEFSEFYYDQAKYVHEQFFETRLPRRDQDLEELLEAVRLQLERAETASQVDLNAERYRLEQKRLQRHKSLEKHAKLISDKGLMAIKSPARGMVYYGRCTNGKWGDLGGMHQKLLPEKSVSRGTVMMTVVDPEELYVLASLGEKERIAVQQDQAVRIEPTAEGADPIKGEVASISVAPIASGKFEMKVELHWDNQPEWLVPGMTNKLKITTYKKEKALLVPKSAVYADKEDEEKRFVWVVEEEDDHIEVEKEWVKTGKTKGENVEILRGLEAGDVISLKKDEKGTDDDDDDHEQED